ncbi:type II toxin-antitoxin system HicB family antitoxin [Methanoculleus sp. FWC-SCC1]|uniref:Type II toxin-antitoxin system HicB family antitoxin n=2 Tax=Methanoculleus frigidifontis TaxID=2584085 RepID=A0ABT8M6J4_9EURY|nr:type II toxin-antitoxin system HicB family antitoxin [Methanoculleus sp. FWC-SCC1]MDN7023551.1 type II toxin-antitoxin system HicB family antitoxin [Methanoculleus sp. FWC-SCC1]
MKYNVFVEKDEDGYFVATIPSLPGCHTQAKSLDELSSRTREAIEAYLDLQGCTGSGCIEIRVTDSETRRSDEGR